MREGVNQMNLTPQPKELTVTITDNELIIADKWGYSIEVEQYENHKGEQRLQIDIGNYLGEGEKDESESLLDIPSSDFPELVEYFEKLLRK